MPESYNTAWSHDFVADKDLPDVDPPELATGSTWRGIMARARATHKIDGKAMTQKQLAAAVAAEIKTRWPRSKIETPSQAIISKIEGGDTKSSKFILPICNVLSIPEPEHFADEGSAKWADLGRAIRVNDERYKLALALLEQMVKDEAAAKAANESASDKPPAKRK